MNNSLRLPVIASLVASSLSGNVHGADIQSFSSVQLPTQKSARAGAPSITETLMIKNALGLEQTDGLALKQSTTDTRGKTHTRYQQTYHGIPVYGMETIVHTDVQSTANGFLSYDIDKDLKGKVIPGLSTAQIQQKIQLQLLLQHKLQLGKAADLFKPRLIVYTRGQHNKAQLAYYAEASLLDLGIASRPHFILDAHSGAVIDAWDGLAHAEAHAHGPGGNEKTGQYEYGIDYASLTVTTADDGKTCIMDNERVSAIDLEHNTGDRPVNTTPFSFPCSRNEYKAINGAFSPINDAYFFGNLIFDLYQDWYGVPALGDRKLIMRVHDGVDKANASWDGRNMSFGDGDDNTYPFVDINVSSHEVSHGFTEFNSNLEYRSQSGGMNESFSDIMGEVAEYYWRGEVDWLVGADIQKSREALRYFEQPSKDGISIDHATQFHKYIDVHHSSGVYNRAYYLLANKDNWNPRLAADVFVHANQNYWTAIENFQTGACGVLQSALDLNYDWKAVADAFIQVGVHCQTFPIDSDQDGMNDLFELTHGFNSTDPDDAHLDFDQDGLSNREEASLGTDPKAGDTDRDGLSDRDEVQQVLSSPLITDTDLDGIPDGVESRLGMNPLVRSSESDHDNDGYFDGAEHFHGSDPANPASTPLVPETSILLENSFERNVDDLSIFVANAFGQPYMRLTDEKASDGQYSVTDSQPTGFSALSVYLDLKTDAVLAFDLDMQLADPNAVLFITQDRDIIDQRVTSTTGWERQTMRLTPGEHLIGFYFNKQQPDDRFFMDNLSLTLTNNSTVDNDGNQLPDLWEAAVGLKAVQSGPDDDKDGDGLSNLAEYTLGTHPDRIDSDGDGINDFDEIHIHKTRPERYDSDSDGMDDGWELSFGFDPLTADQHLDKDGDGVAALVEYRYQSDENNALSTPQEWDSVFFDAQYQTQLDDAFTTGTTGPWRIRDGALGSALYSPVIGNFSESELTIKPYLTNGYVHFTAKTATLAGDRLEFYLNGDRVFALEGEGADSFTRRLPAGASTLTWKYIKDNGYTSINDTVALKTLIIADMDADTDGDGLSDLSEIREHMTNIDAPDTDGDGRHDGSEIVSQSNALVFNPLLDPNKGNNGMGFAPVGASGAGTLDTLLPANNSDSASGGAIGMLLLLMLPLAGRARRR